MKKLFPIIATFCMLILWGCPEKEPVEEDVLTPVKTEYSIGADGGEIAISYKSNLTCSVKSEASWITVPTKTKTVTIETVSIKIAANTSTEERVGKVNVSGGALSAAITIKQAGK